MNCTGGGCHFGQCICVSEPPKSKLIFVPTKVLEKGHDIRWFPILSLSMFIAMASLGARWVINVLLGRYLRVDPPSSNDALQRWKAVTLTGDRPSKLC